MTTRTQWFDNTSEKPEHAGLYELRLPGFGNYYFWAAWTGKHWTRIANSRQGAMLPFFQGAEARYTKFQWRGLANKPT